MTGARPYVASMTPTPPTTAEQLLRTSLPDKRVELVHGVLVVREPPGMRHGRIAMNLAHRLADFVRACDLGQVYAAETGFHLARDPDTVRAPDIAFVAAARVPQPEPTGFAELAPDLVVEVLSPGDRPGETLAKVGDWLEAGTRFVWVIDPERRLARVYRADGSETHLSDGDVLDGEDVVSGFSCPLGDVL
jgi:Uma2 family endonuclease